MRTRSLLLWPFRVIGAVVRLVIWPVVLDAVCYFVLPHGWFVLVAVVSALYMAVVLRIWLRVVRGMLSSMTRGTVTVRGYSARRGRGRRR
jgi:uncharacterized membrane protein SpoIIM required for sporulation